MDEKVLNDIARKQYQNIRKQMTKLKEQKLIISAPKGFYDFIDEYFELLKGEKKSLECDAMAWSALKALKKEIIKDFQMHCAAKYLPILNNCHQEQRLKTIKLYNTELSHVKQRGKTK